MDFIWSEIIIMTKKAIVNKENPNGILVDLTAEEEAQLQKDKENSANEKSFSQIIEEEKALKDSAKAKLVAGEPLTEDEANTIVL